MVKAYPSKNRLYAVEVFVLSEERQKSWGIKTFPHTIFCKRYGWITREWGWHNNKVVEYLRSFLPANSEHYNRKGSIVHAGDYVEEYISTSYHPSGEGNLLARVTKIKDHFDPSIKNARHYTYYPFAKPNC